MNMQENYSFINVNIHNTVFEISDDYSNTYSMNIIISDVNQKYIIKRQTKTKPILIDNPSPIYNQNNINLDDNFELRCKIGWEIQLSVNLYDTKNKIIKTVKADHVTINETMCGAITCYLRDNDNIIGEIAVTMDYYPNHQSFVLLAQESIEDSIIITTSEQNKHYNSSPNRTIAEPLSLALLSELENRINNQNTSIPTDISEGLSYAIKVVQASVSSDKEIDRLLLSTLPPRCLVSSSNNNNNNNNNSNNNNDNGSNGALPTFKVPSLTQDFLSSFTGLLPESLASYADNCSMLLLEKMLSLFTDYTNKDSTNDCLEWHLVRTFIRSASVWFLYRTYVAATIGVDLEVHLKEVFAVLDKFDSYDTNLCGEMSKDELTYLLMDMGLEYEEEEVAVIADFIDHDNLDIIDFGDFMNWWSKGIPMDYYHNLNEQLKQEKIIAKQKKKDKMKKEKKEREEKLKSHVNVKNDGRWVRHQKKGLLVDLYSTTNNNDNNTSPPKTRSPGLVESLRQTTRTNSPLSSSSVSLSSQHGEQQGQRQGQLQSLSQLANQPIIVNSPGFKAVL